MAVGRIGAAVEDEDRAWRLARQVHDGQLDKVGEPYIDHVVRVTAAVRGFAPPELVDHCTLAAILHDVVEAGGVGLDDLLAQGFSPPVVTAVDALSQRPGEPYDDLIERAVGDPIACWVKLADNLDNSDPERLALLGPARAGQLTAKYSRARERLESVTARTD